MQKAQLSGMSDCLLSQPISLSILRQTEMVQEKRLNVIALHLCKLTLRPSSELLTKFSSLA